MLETPEELARLQFLLDASHERWGDVVVYRLDPTWRVADAFKREELLAARGVSA